MKLFKKHTPRWLVFIIDVFICLGSITLAYLLRFNFNIPKVNLTSLHFVFPFVLSVRVLSFLIGRTYSGIVRFTSTKDAERIFIVISGGSIFFVVSNIISYYFLTGRFIVPMGIVIIDFITTVFMMTALRFLTKAIFYEIINSKKDNLKVVIFGADQFGIITKNTLERDESIKYNVVAFLDDYKKNLKKKIDGISISGVENLEDIIKKQGVTQLILSKQPTTSKLKNQIIDICLNNDVKVLTVPDVNFWINGELSFNQIKKINIEDLLERDPIKLDEDKIKEKVLNKTILVTGAAGSIGSEIVRQLLRFKPKKIIIFDQAESPLYDVELSLLRIKKG